MELDLIIIGLLILGYCSAYIVLFLRDYYNQTDHYDDLGNHIVV